MAGARRRTIMEAGAVAVLGLALLLPGLFALGPVESTDARYLEVSREMLETGDLWLPTLAGVPHIEKPPAAYWMGAAGMWSLGVEPGAGRLLQQGVVVVTALLVWAAARRWAGGRGALLAAAVFSTSGLVYVAARGLETDHLQLALLTAAVLALHAAGRPGARAAPLVAGFGLLGAAMWAKGPVALAVALVVWVPWLFLARERTERPPLPRLGLALLVFLAVGLPWYAWLLAAHPGLGSWLVEHQLLGRLEGEVGHPEGPFYLAYGWLGALLPWTPLAVLALWRVRPEGGARDPGRVLLLCWALAPLVFFSLFSSKLMTYLLPCVPAAAIALGVAAEQGRLEDRRARAGEAFGAGLVALAAAGALAFALVPALWHGQVIRQLVPPSGPPAPGAVVALGAALALALARWVPRPGLGARPAASRLLVLAAATALLEVGAFVLAAPRVFTFRETGRLVAGVPGARFVELRTFKAGPLFYVGDLDRIFLAEVARFARKPLVDGDANAGRVRLREADVLAMLRDPAPTFCLARSRDAGRLVQEAPAVVVQDLGRWVLVADAPAARVLGRAPPGEAASRAPGP